MKWNETFICGFYYFVVSLSIFKGISPYHGNCLILPHRLHKVFESTSHKTDDGWLKIVLSLSSMDKVPFDMLELKILLLFCCCCCCWSFRVLLYSLRARCRHTYSIFIHRLSSLIEDRDLCAHVADSLHLRSFCVPFFCCCCCSLSHERWAQSSARESSCRRHCLSCFNASFHGLTWSTSWRSHSSVAICGDMWLRV